MHPAPQSAVILMSLNLYLNLYIDIRLENNLKLSFKHRYSFNQLSCKLDVVFSNDAALHIQKLRHLIYSLAFGLPP